MPPLLPFASTVDEANDGNDWEGITSAQRIASTAGMASRQKSAQPPARQTGRRRSATKRDRRTVDQMSGGDRSRAQLSCTRSPGIPRRKRLPLLPSVPNSMPWY